jgi:polysaccharide biosynthesis/export protein
MRHSLLTALALVAVLLAACAVFEPQTPAPQAPAAHGSGSEKTVQQAAGTAAAAQPGADYEIGPEDVLEIAVWKEEGLKKEVLVRPDGGLSFPLIGEVQASGKTTGQLQAEIKQRLTKYIPQPVVSVSVLKAVSYKIYVVGKVNKPGELTLGRRIDVMQALSLAGGLTPFAEADAIKIIRKTGGGEQVLPFNYSQAQRGRDLGQNILLRTGDTVVVP